MDEVQCPAALETNMKETIKRYHQGEGYPLNEAGPPTSPGSRTPRHRKKSKTRRVKEDKHEPPLKNSKGLQAPFNTLAQYIQ